MCNSKDCICAAFTRRFSAPTNAFYQFVRNKVSRFTFKELQKAANVLRLEWEDIVSGRESLFVHIFENGSPTHVDAEGNEHLHHFSDIREAIFDKYTPIIRKNNVDYFIVRHRYGKVYGFNVIQHGTACQNIPVEATNLMEWFSHTALLLALEPEKKTYKPPLCSLLPTVKGPLTRCFRELFSSAHVKLEHSRYRRWCLSEESGRYKRNRRMLKILTYVTDHFTKSLHHAAIKPGGSEFEKLKKQFNDTYKWSDSEKAKPTDDAQKLQTLILRKKRKQLFYKVKKNKKKYSIQ